ncbi:Cyclin-U4-1 [Diplonema papillatum]|nr:Cyclin-U4-1 [Diplonema papillatum]
MCRAVAPKAAVRPVADVVAALLDDVVQKSAKDARASAYDGLKAPGISMLDYLARWLSYSNCPDDECLVLAVIYIDRVCVHTGVSLTKLNVHRIVIAALTVATKWHQDRVHGNSHYAAVGGVKHAELNRLERVFLNDLQWNTHVSPADHHKYLKQFRLHKKWKAAETDALAQ